MTEEEKKVFSDTLISITTEKRIDDFIDTHIKHVMGGGYDIATVKAILNELLVLFKNVEEKLIKDFNEEQLIFEKFYLEFEKLKKKKELKQHFSRIIEYDSCLYIYDSNIRHKQTSRGIRMKLSRYAINVLSEKIEKISSYIIDEQKALNVYYFCIETNVIDNTITEEMFIEEIKNANFTKIYANSEELNSKSKCKYIIYILSFLVQGKSWYQNAAHSINTEPNKCSGINVPYNWKEAANKLK